MSNGDKSLGLDRRTLLKLTGASTVTGALSTLAGCAGSDNNPQQKTENQAQNQNTNQQQTDQQQAGLKKVPKIHFVTWTQSQKPGYFAQTRMMISEFEKLGLNFQMDPQQFPQPYINTLFQTREFEMLMLGMEGSAYRLEPSFYLNTVLHSSNAGKGGWNITGFSDEKFDRLSEEQQTILDQDERQQVVYELQKIQQNEQAWTVYQYPDLASGLNTNQFEGPEQTVPGEGFGSMWTLTSIKSKGENNALNYGKVVSGIKSFNPLKARAADDIQFIRPFYDTITKIGPSGKAEKWLAEEISVEGKKTVTVTVPSDVTFHDGEPVTGEDVAFSFEFQTKHKAPYVYKYLKPVDTVEANGQSVTFHLKKPYAPFNILTLGQVPILPKHVWGDITQEENLSDPSNYQNVPPVGSGPFEFNRYKAGSFVEMTARTNHPHAPSIDTLRFILYGTKSTAQQALRRGKIDVLDQLPKTLRSGVKRDQELTLNFQPQHGLRSLLHNERRGKPFSDPAFRRALAHAIPRKRIKNQVYGDHAGIGGSIIAKANQFWHNPDVTPFTYDLEKARSILEDAGYDWDDNGTLLYPTN